MLLSLSVPRRRTDHVGRLDRPIESYMDYHYFQYRKRRVYELICCGFHITILNTWTPRCVPCLSGRPYPCDLPVIFPVSFLRINATSAKVLGYWRSRSWHHRHVVTHIARRAMFESFVKQRKAAAQLVGDQCNRDEQLQPITSRLMEMIIMGLAVFDNKHQQLLKTLTWL